MIFHAETKRALFLYIRVLIYKREGIKDQCAMHIFDSSAPNQTRPLVLFLYIRVLIYKREGIKDQCAMHIFSLNGRHIG